jgi:hypothetical protein
MPYRAMALMTAMPLRRHNLKFGVVAVICISLQVLVPTAGMAGAPLKGVDVKLGKNPGSQPAARTGGSNSGGAGVTTVKSGKSNTGDRMGGGGGGKGATGNYGAGCYWNQFGRRICP